MQEWTQSPQQLVSLLSISTAVQGTLPLASTCRKQVKVETEGRWQLWSSSLHLIHPRPRAHSAFCYGWPYAPGALSKRGQCKVEVLSHRFLCGGNTHATFQSGHGLYAHSRSWWLTQPPVGEREGRKCPSVPCPAPSQWRQRAW